MIPFLHKGINTAAKRVGADFLEVAASKIAEGVSRRTESRQLKSV